MTKKSLTLATTLLFVLGMFAVLASPASAVIFVEDNFDSHEGPTSGTLDGDTSDNGLTWGPRVPPYGSPILTGPNYGQGGTDGAGAGGGSHGAQASVISFSPVSTGKVYLSYDVYIGPGATGAGFQPLLLSGAAGSGVTIASGSISGTTGILHEGGAVGNELKENVFQNAPTNVSFLGVYDLDAPKLTVTVKDLDNPANVLIPSYDIVLHAGFTPGQFDIFMNGSCNCQGVNSQGLDNLRIADVAIPEPSSLVLLSLGCVALLATRRRRQV